MSVLQNKTALILGAGAGIGHATCSAMAEAGATIIAVASNEDNLKQLRQNLAGSHHQFWCTNLAKENAGEELTAKLDHFGYPHIVVINFQLPAEKKRVINTTNQSLESKITENIKPVLAILEKTILFQRGEGFGRWIGISSFSAHTGIGGQSLYNMQKAALESLMRNTAVEEGKYGITANSIAPGFIETPSVIKKYPDELRAKLGLANVVRRAGKPEEVAAAIVFLASPLAAYITGITLPVCGGAQLAWNL